MKNELKKIIIAGVAALLLVGCDLERLPYSEVPVPPGGLDPNNIENITRGTYAKLKEEYYFKPIHQVGEYGGDNISLSGSTSDLLYNTYTYRRVNTSHYTANLWQYTYQAVVNVNSMIELITEGESASKDQLLGENYFLRGFLYFNLCNVFGRPYVQSPETNPGVPLKLTTDITDFPSRATVKQVYEQIISDMEKAERLMTENKPDIYASKEVVQAYLSRVYLYMGEWQKAKEYADKVISSGRYTLLQGTAYQNYANAVPESNTETIFAIRMNKDVDFKKYNMDYYSVGALYAEIDNVGWGEMYPSSTYLQLLDKYPQDLRHGFIRGQKLDTPYKWLRYINDIPMYVTREVTESGGTYTIAEKPEDFNSAVVQEDAGGYYVVEKSTSKKRYVVIEDAINKRNDYPKWFIYKCSMQEDQSHLYSPVMIRLAEMYLNRAEAEFHLNGGGLEDINTIRSRAGIPELSSVDLTDILDERRLELAWESQRKYDIFRNGLTLDRNYPGSHLNGSPVHLTVAPTSLLIVELIPQRELNAYPIELEQNPQ
ncbi:RagB/SusD family nutrient uptake outer membrane protein [Dysgonomonas reticulitermitis]